MKQEEIFKKIGGIIGELSEQYDYLKTVQNDLNELELELFVSNAHFLTDHIEVLCKLNLQNANRKRPAPTPEKVEKPEKQEAAREVKYFEPVVQQMKHEEPEEENPKKKVAKTPEGEVAKTDKAEENLPQGIDITGETPKDSYSFRREEPETIRHELVLDESMVWDEEEPAPAEPEEETAASKKKKNEALAEVTTTEEIAETKAWQPAETKQEEKVDVKPEKELKPTTEEPEVLTINQKIAEKTAKAEELAVKPIGDIKLAITLNDKLLYVKDLFNGYNLAYSEAIEILNRFSTFEEAMRFLKTNYITKNNWDSKPATTEKFYALLKRRYA